MNAATDAREARVYRDLVGQLVVVDRDVADPRTFTRVDAAEFILDGGELVCADCTVVEVVEHGASIDRPADEHDLADLAWDTEPGQRGPRELKCERCSVEIAGAS